MKLASKTKWRIVFAVALAVVFMVRLWLPTPVLAQELCGGIFEDTTLGAAESPYTVTCDVTLFPGYTLTIEPGVTIRFNLGTSLIIRGTLNAVGTSDEHITFTSANPPENWGGIPVATNLGGKAIIQFADFSYADTAISFRCCPGVKETANISDSTFTNNGTAIGDFGGMSNIVILNSTFEDNDFAISGIELILFADFSYADTAISVECCGGVKEPANFSDSTFTNNGTAIGDYAGNNVVILNSTFEDNDFAINSADKIIYNSVFRNNTYGLYRTEGFSVYNSIFEGHQVALYGGRGTVQDCIISGNGTGVEAYLGGFTLSGNTITNNDIGVILTEFPPPVEYNNIFENTTYNAKVRGSGNKSAPNNWWGTTDTAAIDSKIYDGRDDSALGLLEYLPFLEGLSADFAVAKTDSDDPLLVGTPLTYTITVTNKSPITATGVILTDTLPAGVTFGSVSTGCSESNGVVTCKLGDLSGGAIVMFTSIVTPTTAGTLTNTVTVAGNEFWSDPDLSNNTATESTTIETETWTVYLPVMLNTTGGMREASEQHPNAGKDIINVQAHVAHFSIVKMTRAAR